MSDQPRRVTEHDTLEGLLAFIDVEDVRGMYALAIRREQDLLEKIAAIKAINPPTSQDLTDDYKAGFRDVLRDIREILNAKGGEW